MTITMALAERIQTTDFQNMPAAARVVAEQALMDFIGVTVAGMDEPLTRILREEAAEEGGNAQATIIGTGGRGTLAQAALINGSAGHAHDYDDVHTAMMGHPTVPVAPVVLALGEHLNVSGPRLIAAFAAGVDTECIVGRYLGPSHYAHGWHATGTLGSLGAAAAGANLMGLDSEATARALGIATTQAAGLKSQFGTMCKPLHAGHAAMTGLSAARLAARGFSSRPDMLETEQGLAATQSTTASPEGFEKAMRVDSYVPDICFKYHAACYLAHSAIEGTRQLVEANGLTGNDVDEVELTVDPGHFRVCNIQAPGSGLEAKFSLRFTTAMALAGEDTAGIDSYTNELTEQADLVALRDKVNVTAWDDPKPETRVRIRAGAAEHATEINVGIPNRDLDDQWTKLTGKCLALTGNPAIADACRALGETRDLAAFFDVIRGQRESI